MKTIITIIQIAGILAISYIVYLVGFFICNFVREFKANKLERRNNDTQRTQRETH